MGCLIAWLFQPKVGVSCHLSQIPVSTSRRSPHRRSKTHASLDARALVRLQADHINRSLVPSFYRYLQAQETEKQIEYGREFHASLEGLVNILQRAEQEILGPGGTSGEGEAQALKKGLGVWIADEENLGWSDIMAGPCMYFADI